MIGRGGALPISALVLLTPGLALRTIRHNQTSVAGSCSTIGCGASYDKTLPCQCNVECPRYKNCCSDFEDLCGDGLTPAPAPSCASIGCGVNYNKNLPCQCNTKCNYYYNCCSDFASLCAAPTPAPIEPSPGLGAAMYWEGVDTSDMAALKARMSKGVTRISYSELMDVYNSAWVDLPGKCQGSIYDIYSLKCWTPGVEKCGNYKQEGDCYNREHSWPKSWWGLMDTPAYSDMFHVMPSDGYVNGKRSSLPFGDVRSASYTSSEGHKTGSCDLGTCFEPTARVKGVLARGHFYIATRYKGDFDTSIPLLSSIIRWHEENPPEAWEKELNDRVETWQGNRNPYIDFPSLVSEHFR